MAKDTTDTRFFTNRENGTLLDRFRSTLKHVDKFDVLVGFFRISGFYALYKDLEKVNNIRILNGIDVDKHIYKGIELNQQRLDFDSGENTKQGYSKKIEEEATEGNDDYQEYVGYNKFLEFLKSGKIELKQHPSHKLHAKVYISRFGGEVAEIDFGRVITGSSNFSQSGLSSNLEFNVELKDRMDVEFALNQFEKLWDESEDVKNICIETLENKTWLTNKVTPYELYLKTLYEYFYEDINLDKETDFSTPDGYLNLEYQKQAVVSASKILDAYNGVFIADVVGIGKTFVSALLSQQPALKSAQKLFIVPPVLEEYWTDTLTDFGISKFKVWSAGKIKNLKKWERIDEVEYIFLDEAHRYRNEDTETWTELYKICFGKKIILISATPLNNRFRDFLSLLKLFQRPSRSNIPGIRNLQRFIMHWENEKERAKKNASNISNYVERVREGATEIREKILKHVMIRRTRKEIKKYYNDDLVRQGVDFPEIADPVPIVYEFNQETSEVFDKTIQFIKNEFTKARYTPNLYLTQDIFTDFEKTQQNNLGGFMKTMLVKRLESSFHAFKKTLSRFILSHENFIRMVNSGTVLISKSINVFDLIDDDDDDKIFNLIKKGEVTKYKSSDFNKKFLYDLNADLTGLRRIQDLWKDMNVDPKILILINEIKNDTNLADKKMILFTEAAETANYLLEKLNKEFGNQVMLFSGKGGRIYEDNTVKTINRKASVEKIRANFDPDYRKPENIIKILVSTDVLAEGVNLHKSNIVVNYDLPWNPTKVIQRLGRVNRVGTEHKNIHIYNFFPTVQSDDVIQQKKNIISKIQAFHDCLGGDAKFLTEDEDVQTHKLFGTNLYETLNTKTYYEEEDERSELEYLHTIRNIRDKNKELYKKIKQVPLKSRSSKKHKQSNHLLSFFRIGKLKKFIMSSKEKVPTELSFLDAITLMECKDSEKKFNLPKDYFDLLVKNKDHFNQILTEIDEEGEIKKSGQSNEQQCIKLLKSLRKEPDLREDDHILRSKLLRAFEDGVIARKTARDILKEIEIEDLTNEPIKILVTFRKHIPEIFIDQTIREKIILGGKKEIILSLYLSK